jgi:predicted amidohydrolase YtcJ
MLIDTYTAGRIYSLRQTLKPDEKVVVRYGCILEVGKKTKLELIRDKVVNYALCKVR